MDKDPYVNPKDLVGCKKPPLSLVPSSAIIYESIAMRDGADKYGPYNWREKKVVASIYLDACKRHLALWQDGEECAKDSGAHHLGHARACLGIIIDAMECGNLVDDRPMPANTAALMERLTVSQQARCQWSPGQGQAHCVLEAGHDGGHKIP